MKKILMFASLALAFTAHAATGTLPANQRSWWSVGPLEFSTQYAPWLDAGKGALLSGDMLSKSNFVAVTKFRAEDVIWNKDDNTGAELRRGFLYPRPGSAKLRLSKVKFVFSSSDSGNLLGTVLTPTQYSSILVGLIYDEVEGTYKMVQSGPADLEVDALLLIPETRVFTTDNAHHDANLQWVKDNVAEITAVFYYDGTVVNISTASQGSGNDSTPVKLTIQHTAPQVVQVTFNRPFSAWRLEKSEDLKTWIAVYSGTGGEEASPLAVNTTLQGKTFYRVVY